MTMRRWPRSTKTTKAVTAKAIKNNAIIKKIKERHLVGQPLLVFTSSINKSEVYSKLLKKENINQSNQVWWLLSWLMIFLLSILLFFFDFLKVKFLELSCHYNLQAWYTLEELINYLEMNHSMLDEPKNIEPRDSIIKPNNNFLNMSPSVMLYILLKAKIG